MVTLQDVETLVRIVNDRNLKLKTEELVAIVKDTDNGLWKLLLWPKEGELTLCTGSLMDIAAYMLAMYGPETFQEGLNA